MSTIKTYVALILDKSGSMSSIREKAIKDFNEQIQTLKSQSNSPKEITKKLLKNDTDTPATIVTNLTLVTFADTVDFLNFNEDVNIVQEISPNDYRPNGSTALMDAIGETLDRFAAEIPEIQDPDTGALIIIVTDGEENSSKRYGGQHGKNQLKKRIDELQATGKWTITFMGAENVWAISQDLGLAFGNTAKWDPSTVKGNVYALSARSLGTENYYKERLTGHTAVQNFYSSIDEAKLEEDVKEKLKKLENKTKEK